MWVLLPFAIAVALFHSHYYAAEFTIGAGSSPRRSDRGTVNMHEHHHASEYNPNLIEKV